VYVAATDEVFFASSRGTLGMSDPDHNNAVGKISLKDVEAALAANETTINVPVTTVSL
jgi:gluconolactonase